MLGSDILEVAMGVIFLYILVSVMCTAVREAIEGVLKTRAAYLERGIRELLRDREGAGLARSFYAHPLIGSLYSGEYRPGTASKRVPVLARGRGMPSYIPAKNFALVLMDIAARGRDTDEVSSDPGAPALTLESVRANVLNIRNPGVQRVLLTAIDTAGGDFDRAVANLQAWFDSGMDRVSGWYKRASQWIVFWTALFLAVSLNVDTLRVADFLYRDDVARAAVVARAEAAAAALSAPDTAPPGSAGDTAALRRYREARAELDSLRLPIGWGAEGSRPVPPGGSWLVNVVLLSIPGWLLTALAATLGAPFWFDVLNRIMVIRSTVKPREKSPEEGSEDRQPRHRGRGGASEDAVAAAAAGAAAGAGAGAGAGGGELRDAGPPGWSAPPATPSDAQSAVDGCDVDIVEETPDEELPAAEGGVG